MRWVAGAWLAGVLVATTPAAATDKLDWNSLRPAAAPADNPFERLTPQQTDWITEIALGRLMQARGRPVSAEAAARRAALSAALADLLLVNGDPIANIKLIEDPAKNFVVIMKDGQIYKNTLP